MGCESGPQRQQFPKTSPFFSEGILVEDVAVDSPTLVDFCLLQIKFPRLRQDSTEITQQDFTKTPPRLSPRLGQEKPFIEVEPFARPAPPQGRGQQGPPSGEGALKLCQWPGEGGLPKHAYIQRPWCISWPQEFQISKTYVPGCTSHLSQFNGECLLSTTPGGAILNFC